jgi:hypothetical protein
MIKVTGIEGAVKQLDELRRRLEEVSTTEGIAGRLNEKHAHLVCPEHGERPRYAVKPEDGKVTGTYCCAKLREMAKEDGFNPL